MCDVTMLQFLPWRRSVFYTESNGYPNFHVMKFVLGIETIQTLVSVSCQMVHLAAYTDVNDPTMLPEAKALFTMNILFAGSSVLFGLVMMVVRNKLLITVQTSRDREKGSNYPTTENLVQDDNVNGDVQLYGMTNPMMIKDSGSGKNDPVLRTVYDNVLRLRSDCAHLGEAHERATKELNELRKRNRSHKSKSGDSSVVTL
jgi:hypothetical protein